LFPAKNVIKRENITPGPKNYKKRQEYAFANKLIIMLKTYPNYNRLLRTLLA